MLVIGSGFADPTMMRDVVVALAEAVLVRGMAAVLSLAIP
jgi:hypothetical protein